MSSSYRDDLFIAATRETPFSLSLPLSLVCARARVSCCVCVLDLYEKWQCFWLGRRDPDSEESFVICKLPNKFGFIAGFAVVIENLTESFSVLSFLSLFRATVFLTDKHRPLSTSVPLIVTL